MQQGDFSTAQAFANSWNNLPNGSVYTKAQFDGWMEPLSRKDVEGKRVLELGCGNGSLMVHMADWGPARLDGVDLGDSVLSARENTKQYSNVSTIQDDLVTYTNPHPYDLVYCVGVLHHLKNPHAGFQSVIRNTRTGGKFHCWVYAREGNWIVIHIVDPVRKLACRMPWWFTKYVFAAPLVAPFYIYAKILRWLPRWDFLKKLPLYEYALYMAQREYAFFHHMAFDQLVTPQTTYLSKQTLESWLNAHPSIDQHSIYITMRNGNSWRFGGTKK